MSPEEWAELEYGLGFDPNQERWKANLARLRWLQWETRNSGETEIRPIVSKEDEL